MRATLFFLLALIVFVSAQDSLYCVNTLVGDSVNKIISAKGAGDMNGDGYADLVVSYTDSVKVFLGNDRFELKPAYAYGNNNGFVLCPGDVNGDGYADLLIGEKRFQTGTHDHISNIHLLFGGETIDTCTTFGYEVSLWDQIFSKQVDPIGDVNGDGYIDFAISSPYNWSNGISYVFLYLGGDSISSKPFVTLNNYLNNHSLGTFGEAVSGIGDMNKDGYDDIAVGDPGYDDTLHAESSGAVYLYYGGVAMDSIADTLLTFHDIYFGSNLKNLGDINNDGTTDFAATSYDSCVIFLNLDSIMTTRFYGSGHGIGGNGEVNNDGIMDLIIGDPSYKDNTNFIGRFDIYNGKSNFKFITDYTNIGEQYGSLFTQYSDFIGDFNGDGYDDIYVVAPTFRKNGKEIGKLYVYSLKKVDGIRETKKTVLNNFHLFPNYPNPFNPSTTIMYEIPQTSEVQIKIYDVRGRIVRTLVNKKQKSGSYKVLWNGRNNIGRKAASGVYFYVLTWKNRAVSRKMLLLR